MTERSTTPPQLPESHLNSAKQEWLNSDVPHNWESFAFDPKQLRANKSAENKIRNFAHLRRWLIATAGIFLIASSGAIYAIWNYFDHSAISEYRKQLNEIVSFRTPDNSIVYSRDGQVIAEIYDRYQIYKPLEAIPNVMIQAVIAIEDRNFYQHRGIDYKAIMRAAWVHMSGKPYSQGASTISQQLVRQFMLTRAKTIDRKLREATLAMEFERRLSKDRILELYLNNMFLGNGAYGVAAAARKYFGKDLAAINVAEAALIAGLFQSPSSYNPMKHPQRAKKRQRSVLSAMHRDKLLDQKSFTAAVDYELNYRSIAPIHHDVAPYFVDYVRDQIKSITGKDPASAGLRIHTTLDLSMQQATLAAMQENEARIKRIELFNKNQIFGSNQAPIIEAALLTVDATNGEILAMQGGRDYKHSQYNRAAQSLRSPGSAFKPILFAMALAKGWKWSDLMYVDPINVKDYRPKNASSEYFSETTLLRAFYKSINTPTVELSEKLGIQNVVQFAKKMGITATLKEESGTALGASEVSMLDLARAYSVFANQGRLAPTVAIKKIYDYDNKILFQSPEFAKVDQVPAGETDFVMTPQVAYLMTEGMRSVLNHGTGARSAALSEFAAGKTGTSNNSEDNWFCGYTKDIVTIAWVGSDNHVPIDGKAAGNTLALPLWENFIRQIQKIRQPSEFEAPPGIVAAKVNPEFGHQDEAHGIEMFFLETNMPSKKYSALQQLRQTGGNYRSIFTK